MAHRESDRCIVPLKLDNVSSGTKPGNAGGGKASKLSRAQVVPPPAPSGESLVTSRLERITNRAEHHPDEVFTNLFTLLDVELLRLAFDRLERNKCPGVDGRTVRDYESNLESNLQDLEDRLHRGSYRPQPSLRRDIPKGDGKKTRPLGIASVEDKLVQRAVVMILERIYEVDFCESSFGFRPGRSCHEALGVLGKIISTKKVNWILDADIKGFFDTVDHERLVELLQARIGDPRMLRLIERFLKAGVMIEGRRYETEEGVAQGSVLSPLLANVYLHYVLDAWFERDVRPRLQGEAYLVRYADDFILGFTHYCGHSRAGRFKLKRRTSKKKMRGKVRDMKVWLRSQLTVPIAEVWPILNAKLRGHYQYYGINDNWPHLIKYQRLVERLSFRWMRRRSQKGKTHSWSDYRAFVSRHPLALPRRLTDLIALYR